MVHKGNKLVCNFFFLFNLTVYFRRNHLKIFIQNTMQVVDMLMTNVNRKSYSNNSLITDFLLQVFSDA